MWPPMSVCATNNTARNATWLANRPKKPIAARVPMFAARAAMGCLVPAKEFEATRDAIVAIRVP